MILGSTVYVFSIILAVFLLGLAIGGGIGAWILRKTQARLALGWSQILLALAIAFTAYMITRFSSLLAGTTGTTSPAETFRGDLLRCLVAILPPTIFGAPASRLQWSCKIVAPGEDSGRTVGGVYAANTLGAIIGALGVSLILIPVIGTQQCQRLFVADCSCQRALRFDSVYPGTPFQVGIRPIGSCVGFRSSTLRGTFILFPGKSSPTGAGFPQKSPSSTVLYTIEGINSSRCDHAMGHDDAVEVDVNGHVEATTEPFDMKLQRMVGHLPALLHPHPVSVLGIGFGAGVSAGTFTTYPGIQKITVCEIEPVIPPTSTRYFAQQDYNVLHNPKSADCL